MCKIPGRKADEPSDPSARTPCAALGRRCMVGREGSSPAPDSAGSWTIAAEGNDTRRLPHRRSPRSGRDGGGVRGDPAVAPARRRAEAARLPPQRRPRVPRALPPRGADPGADRAPAHRHGLRGRRDAGRAVHRHAARARRDAQGHDRRARARPGADAADPRAAGRGARRGPRGGPDPPRHQAPEHPRRQARPRLPRRLRADQGRQGEGASPRPATSSARSTTSRRSRSAASRPPARATSTRSRASCSSA